MSRKKRRKFISADEQREEMALQITSMADIFVIILVFLLKSIASGTVDISPTKGMILPSVNTVQSSTMKAGTRIEVLPNGILVDQKMVLALKNFAIQRAPADIDKEQLVLEPVYQALLKERAKSDKKESETKIFLLAHEKTPYSTLKTIMTSAANAGYTDLQLVVLGAQ